MNIVVIVDEIATGVIVYDAQWIGKPIYEFHQTPGLLLVTGSYPGISFCTVGRLAETTGEISVQIHTPSIFFPGFRFGGHGDTYAVWICHREKNHADLFPEFPVTAFVMFQIIFHCF